VKWTDCPRTNAPADLVEPVGKCGRLVFPRGIMVCSWYMSLEGSRRGVEGLRGHMHCHALSSATLSPAHSRRRASGCHIEWSRLSTWSVWPLYPEGASLRTSVDLLDEHAGVCVCVWRSNAPQEVGRRPPSSQQRVPQAPHKLRKKWSEYTKRMVQPCCTVYRPQLLLKHDTYGGFKQYNASRLNGVRLKQDQWSRCLCRPVRPSH
jgi:hypothetical protein